ncbi:MAG: hypothetical protein MHM6MM_006876 [Cercozoa sp. M6MM]
MQQASARQQEEPITLAEARDLLSSFGSEDAAKAAQIEKCRQAVSELRSGQLAARTRLLQHSQQQVQLLTKRAENNPADELKRRQQELQQKLALLSSDKKRLEAVLAEREAELSSLCQQCVQLDDDLARAKRRALRRHPQLRSRSDLYRRVCNVEWSLHECSPTRVSGHVHLPSACNILPFSGQVKRSSDVFAVVNNVWSLMWQEFAADAEDTDGTTAGAANTTPDEQQPAHRNPQQLQQQHVQQQHKQQQQHKPQRQQSRARRRTRALMS